MKRLNELLDELDSYSKEHINGVNPEVKSLGSGENIKFDSTYIEAKRWHSINDAVAVFADLRGSSNLSRMFSHSKTVASIYQGSTGSLTKIFKNFDSNYIQVQGDGVLAIYLGEDRYERALCAAITVQKTSNKIANLILTKANDPIAVSGYKIGVSSSNILVKRMGVPREANQQSLVWAGNAVNYAVKACEQAEDGLVVTNSVWEKVKSNDFLSISCSCGIEGKFSILWTPKGIEKIAPHQQHLGYQLHTAWCDIHGSVFMDAILERKRTRNEPEIKVIRDNLEDHAKAKALALSKIDKNPYKG